MTLEDLDAFPVWEYCTDEEEVEGQDETWIRPVRSQQIPREMYSLTVACDFTTAIGSSLRGFIGVTTIDGSVEIGSGVILNERKPYLWFPRPEIPLPAKTKKELSAGIGLKEAELFPIKYMLSVKVSGEKRRRGGVLS